jgi:hypothetical protein
MCFCKTLYVDKIFAIRLNISKRWLTAEAGVRILFKQQEDIFLSVSELPEASASSPSVSVSRWIGRRGPHTTHTLLSSRWPVHVNQVGKKKRYFSLWQLLRKDKYSAGMLRYSHHTRWSQRMDRPHSNTPFSKVALLKHLAPFTRRS